MKCVWFNNSVYDGIERTWKMKEKSSIWQTWITLARPIFRPLATHTLEIAGVEC